MLATQHKHKLGKPNPYTLLEPFFDSETTTAIKTITTSSAVRRIKNMGAATAAAATVSKLC